MFGNKTLRSGLIAMLATGAMAVVVLTARELTRAEVRGETPKERARDIVRLGSDRSYGAADAIAAKIASDPDPAVRRVAVVCIERFSRPKDRPVIEAATRDADPSVRQAAVGVLMRAYCDDDAAARLADVFTSDSDTDTRQAAANALAASGNDRAMVTVIQHVDGIDSPERTMAANAMIRTFDIPHATKDMAEETWPKLVEAIKDMNEVGAAFEATGTPLIRNQQIVEEITREHAANCHEIEHDHANDAAGNTHETAITTENKP
ncbi:MAG: HEAT repeat domain-containing protein [Planctomycetota bacterium]|jgi:HEAT repeat protein